MKKRFWTLLVFGIVFAVAMYLGRMGVELESDGAMVKPALDVANGKILFRETFTQYGALTTYFHALLLIFFGKKLIILKAATAVAYAVTGVFIWLLGRKVMGSIWALGIVGFWLMLAPYYVEPFYTWASVYGAMAQTVIVYLLFEELTARKSFLLGIVTGLVFWIKQPFLIVTGVMAIVVRKKEFYTGLILVNILMFGVIWLQGSGRDWYLQTIRTSFAMGKTLGNSWVFDSKYLFWLFVPLGCFWVFVKENKYWGKWGMIAFLGFAQYFPLADYSHIYWGATPAFVMWGYFLKKSWNAKNWLVLLLVLILVVPEIWIRVNSVQKKIETNTETLTYPEVLWGMKVSPSQKTFFGDFANTLNNYLTEHPDKKVVLVGYESMLTTFNERSLNIGPFYSDYSGYASGFYGYILERDQYINSQKPVLIVNKINSNPAGYTTLKEFTQTEMRIAVPDWE